jgi:RHS repeat-associated protein
MASRSQRGILRVWAIVLPAVAFLFANQTAKAQCSISGATCIVPGVQYTYTFSGTWSGNTGFTWSIGGGAGTFQGSSSGNGLVHVTVIWNGSGTLYVTTTNPSCNTSTSVSAAPTLVPGTISNPTQHINYNTIPAMINCSAATGGYCSSPNYTYQWQSSTNNVSFNNITGATSLNLSFTSALTSTMYYRQFVTETNSSQTAYTATATVFVYPVLVPGSVSPSPQTINYNTAPSTMSLSGVSGGTGTWTYQWQSSPDNATWTAIAYATGVSYTPAPVSTLTYYNVAVTSGYTLNSSSATVNVNPEVFPGTISPSNISIVSGKSPGLISGDDASGGACGGSYSYQWQNSTDGVHFSTISGATSLTYSPGTLTAATWYRRQVTCGTDAEYSNTCAVSIVSTTADMNYIKVRALLKAGVMDSTSAANLTSPYDLSQTMQYLDGLGRVIQTVAMQQSPLQNDLVTFNEYDNYGREISKYLPFVDTPNNGLFKYSGASDQYNFNSTQFPSEQYYYSLISFEPSPMNRVSVTYAPGTNWVGSSRGVTAQYLVNQGSDSVRNWNIAYPIGSIPTSSTTYAAGTLYKSISTDEGGHQVVEYKDLQGRMMLKKVQISASPGTAHVGWLCTYYVYDDLGFLRFVIPPQAVVLISSSWSISASISFELCFRFEYDAHGHTIIKKIPGAGESWMVYDMRDRIVMNQDSNLRAFQKWLFTKYDVENRPDSSGLITDPTYYNNLTYYDTTAFKSAYFPQVNSYTNELLTQTYYDDYSWVSGTGASIGSTMATNNSNNSNYFYTTYNGSPAYAVAMTPFYINRGLTTGSMKKVIGTTSQYLYSASFFDDRARVIQTQEVNFTGAIDTVSLQFDFSGKPLRNLLGHKKNGNTVQSHVVVAKMDYDQGLRLRHIWKNIDNAATDQLIDSIQYDELGHLRVKYIGNNVDSVIYDYNVRDWIIGINRSFVAGTANHFFGMELGYDKSSSIAPGNTYLTPEYNGNIEGVSWKSFGDGINRKYDFSYDYANRLTGAAFLQNTSGTAWDKNYLDFSVGGLTYDANSNIVTMNQRGFTVGGSSAVDSLTYSYLNTNGSNKLMGVIDVANNPNSLLGDFHYNPATKQSTDYTYDGNGNLLTDNNKAIDKIIYNYLNLPQLVHLNAKGNIAYTYDAVGTRLAKIIMDSTSKHSITRTYIGPLVYQQTDTITSPGGGNDTLQFIGNEEGRTRWAYHKYMTGATAFKFEYDFFERDHLANTRMVLTQQKDTAQYLASMEAAYRATEVQLFSNITSTCYPRASVSGYPDDLTYTNPNDSVSKVDYNGTSGQKTGPSLLLKVMSGDTVKFGVQSYYNSGSGSTNNSSFNDVLNTLAAVLVSTTGGDHGTVANLTASGSTVYSGLSSFLSANDPAPTGYPKAYLNWIFLDDQFNYASSLSGSVQAASSTYPSAHLNTVAPGSQLILTKNGYLYIWVSNETQGWDVFFDNLSIQHRQGPLLEENHYYPFGLAMQGICDKAVKSNYFENKYRYNGKEIQNKEFSDGTGLEWADYGARMFDDQLGRFFTLDNASLNYMSFSPYMYGANNPLRFMDIQGLGPGDRIKKAVDMEGTKYSQNKILNQGEKLRTENTPEALEYLDCSEFVCRVMAYDGITNGVKDWNTGNLLNFLDDKDKFIRSENEPQPGDIFLWRDDKHGHTGVVLSYDKKTGNVTTAEARGKDFGTLEVTRNISAFTEREDFKGFFRPINENPDRSEKSGDAKKKTKESDSDKFSRLMNNAAEAIKNSNFLIEQVKKNKEEEKFKEIKEMQNANRSSMSNH